MSSKRFLTPILIGGLGYFGLIILLAWIQIDGRDNHLALVYGILPVLPGLIMLVAVMAAYRDMDEMERRIHAEALVIAFVLSLLAFFAYGMLQAFSGFPALNLALAAAGMTVTWGIGELVSWRRYR